MMLVLLMLLAAPAWAIDLSNAARLTTTHMHKRKTVSVSVDPATTEHVCVEWDQPFSRCAFTGDHPLAPCQTSTDCGTSEPCTFPSYFVNADVQDETMDDMRGLTVVSIAYLNPSQACVVLWNQDPDTAHSGVVAIDGYTGGLE